MNWQKEVDEIARRKALAMRMGGRQNVDRHHKAGKLTARERINLFESLSFEIIHEEWPTTLFAGVPKIFATAKAFFLIPARVEKNLYFYVDK